LEIYVKSYLETKEIIFSKLSGDGTIKTQEEIDNFMRRLKQHLKMKEDQRAQNEDIKVRIIEEEIHNTSSE